ncbi:hypothetical protein [Catenulispora pinisilvae]|uniref:hypothetical protein n=1 Tax=Catenulispora pinisilvae TaxID=2705253 RepID=UPI0018917CDA|nr:hypothetical protein [Catenulispora pinisilvae]
MTPNDRPAGGLRKRDPVQGLHKPPFELTGLGRGADTFDHDRILADLATNTIEQEGLPDGGYLVALAADALSKPSSLTIGADGEDLIEDARADIAAGHFEIALALLEEYLGRFASHQEARFLRAYCLTHIAEPQYEQALRILRPLRDEVTPKELGERIRTLRRELRRRLTPGEYKAYADTAESDPRGALARAADFLELVPEDGKLNYLLAAGHARLGELDQALDAAERGVLEADSERQRIEDLASQLRLILLRPMAEPAARAFKSRNPQLALALLDGIEPRWRESGPIQDFERYLVLLIQHRNPPVPPAPLLPDDRADDLYSLIAENDVSRALALMDRGGLERAEQLLAALMTAVPGFRWLNFVYAILLYENGRRPEQAEACARVAMRDPTIAQARDLLEAIHAWQESIVINPVVEEFVAVLDALNDKPSARQLPRLRSRLVAVQAQIPALRKAVRTAEGKKAVEHLGTATGNWISELDKAEVVSAFFDEYERIMTPVVGGLKTVRDANQLATALDALGVRIRAARTGTGSTGGSGKQDRAHPLDELADRVEARRAEAGTARTTIEVSELVRRFNTLMAPLTSGSPDARLFQAVAALAKPIGQEAVRLRNAAGRGLDSRDRQSLDQLIATIERLWP